MMHLTFILTSDQTLIIDPHCHTCTFVFMLAVRWSNYSINYFISCKNISQPKS